MLQTRGARAGARARDSPSASGPPRAPFDLEERTRAAVKDIPQRLRGGSSADAIRAAGTRGRRLSRDHGAHGVPHPERAAARPRRAWRRFRDENSATRLHTIVRDGGRARRAVHDRVARACRPSAGLLVAVTARLVDVPGRGPSGAVGGAVGPGAADRRRRRRVAVAAARRGRLTDDGRAGPRRRSSPTSALESAVVQRQPRGAQRARRSVPHARRRQRRARAVRPRRRAVRSLRHQHRHRLLRGVAPRAVAA